MSEYGGYIYIFMGSFNCGIGNAFLRLICTFSQRIQMDINEDVVALWHDESHLNRYFWENRKYVNSLSKYQWI
jgi:hypothetical protein